jgi:hypothetical protein
VWFYDREANKTIWKVDIPTDKATGAHEWYDLGEWIEEGSDCSLLVDTYGGAFVIDCVEVSAVSSATTGRK